MPISMIADRPRAAESAFATPRSSRSARARLIDVLIVVAVALILAGTVYGLTLPVHAW